MTGPVVFVDCETTGLDPDPARHQIWEVALGEVGDDGMLALTVWQLPVDLGLADPMALRIGRFMDRRLPFAEQTSPRSFARTFMKLTAGKVLCGAVPSFDEERLRRLLQQNDCCPMWDYHMIDVEALAVGALREREIAVPVPWRSDDLSRLLGVPADDKGRHTAEGDVRWAATIYDTIMRPEPRIALLATKASE